MTFFESDREFEIPHLTFFVQAYPNSKPPVMKKRILFSVILMALSCLFATQARATEMLFGAASADITPDEPVPLTGYRSVRISKGILSRCQANVLAIESREGGKIVDQAILVACDLCVIRPGIQEGFRKYISARLPDFDISKLFLAATHTHTAPVLLQDRYNEKDYGNAMQPKDYVPFMYERMAEAVVKAWNERKVGALAWGLGNAVVASNRRAVFSDGKAKMYGNTNTSTFRRIEGFQDHAVDILCFYDEQKKLKATAITLACPSQSVRGSLLSADFWHDVRELIRERHGEDIIVLGFCAPAGDQGPHLLYRKKSEARMDRLRKLTRTQELGRRIANAFDDVLGVIAQDIRTDVSLIHSVERVNLPGLKVKDSEYDIAKKICDALDAKEKMVGPDWWTRHFYGYVLDRYDAQQKADPVYPLELHTIRLGDVAIATNPFELYVDYGVQIQSRSPAEQTFLIQLAAPLDFAYYVPTPRAVEAGGYSAEVTHNLIGPKGAQVLVDETVRAIKALWSGSGKKVKKP